MKLERCEAGSASATHGKRRCSLRHSKNIVKRKDGNYYVDNLKGVKTLQFVIDLVHLIYVHCRINDNIL